MSLKPRMVTQKDFKSGKMDTLAVIPADYFTHTANIIEATIVHLKHIREFAPNPTLIDNRISELNNLWTEYQSLAKADQYRKGDTSATTS